MSSCQNNDIYGQTEIKKRTVIADTEEFQNHVRLFNADTMTLKLLAEISATLTRMEEQRFAEFEHYKHAVKRLERWDSEGLPKLKESV